MILKDCKTEIILLPLAVDKNTGPPFFSAPDVFKVLNLAYYHQSYSFSCVVYGGRRRNVTSLLQFGFFQLLISLSIFSSLFVICISFELPFHILWLFILSAFLFFSFLTDLQALCILGINFCQLYVLQMFSFYYLCVFLMSWRFFFHSCILSFNKVKFLILYYHPSPPSYGVWFSTLNPLPEIMHTFSIFFPNGTPGWLSL